MTVTYRDHLQPLFHLHPPDERVIQSTVRIEPSHGVMIQLGFYFPHLPFGRNSRNAIFWRQIQHAYLALYRTLSLGSPAWTHRLRAVLPLLGSEDAG
jgi:hypothetical protein